MTRWGVWNSGRLHLAQYRRAINHPNRQWEQYITDPIPVLKSSQQWNQIAVVYDSKNQEVRQFVNGDEFQRWETPSNDSMRLGHLAIGNLSVDEREIALGVNREFFGAIDEVVISSRVYSPEEIQANYHVGKP